MQWGCKGHAGKDLDGGEVGQEIQAHRARGSVDGDIRSVGGVKAACKCFARS